MINQQLILLLSLAICWGPTFFFNKMAVAEIPILTVIAIRIGLATAFLLPLSLLNGLKFQIKRQQLFHLIVMSWIALIFPFFFYAAGAMHIPVGVGTMVNGTMPFFTAILAHFFLANEKINKYQIVGMCCGVIGLASLSYPSLSQNAHAGVLGLTMVCCAAMSNAAGMVYARRFLTGIPALVSANLQLTFGTLFILPIALIMDQPWNWTSMPSTTALLCSSLSAILGTALAYRIYFHLIQTAGATYLSLVTYIMPLIGTLMGVFFLGEELSKEFLLGSTCVLTGMYIVERARGMELRKKEIRV